MTWYNPQSEPPCDIDFYRNGTKVWRLRGCDVPLKIEYHTGDTIVLNSDGSVACITDSTGKFWSSKTKYITIIFGEMGAGKSFWGKRCAMERPGATLFEGDDVVSSEMLERVSKFKPLTREIVSSYVRDVLVNEIVRRAEKAERELVVAQALYSNADREFLLRHLTRLGYRVNFDYVKAPIKRNVMQLFTRENGCRWALYHIMNKPYFEKPTHQHSVIEFEHAPVRR